MLALDRPVPPGLDLGVDLLVEVGDRARAHPRAPERLGDVLDPPHRDAGEVHLDQRLLDRALPAPVALDDRRLEGLPPQLRNLQADLAGPRLQRPLVVARAGVLARLAALVAPGAAQPVRLGVEHRVQRFLDRPAHHLAEVIPDPRLVDLDHLAHRLGLRLLVHPKLLSAILKGAASLGKCAKDPVRYL